MHQQPSFRTDTRTSVTLRVDPRVILSSQLLEMARAELDTQIEVELQENPALERLEDDLDPLNEDQILGSIAPGELVPSGEDREFMRSLPFDESVEWLDFASSSDALVDHLAAQLLPGLTPELRTLGAYLVGGLDERGYLTVELEEAALDTQRSLEDAVDVLHALQACEPAGIGARDLRECLLLQLRDETSHEGRLARGMLRHCFDEVVARNVRPIMRRFRALPDLVEAAFDVIAHLNPFPASGYRVHNAPVMREASHMATADLVLDRRESGWVVEVPGAEGRDFAVSRAYRSRLGELEQRVSVDARDERRHLAQHVDRAKRFMESLDQRKRTLRRVGEYLAQHQAGFCTTGDLRFLGSLTRSRMASDLGLHESTVSRATQGKFVQIATGEVISFEVFFKPALRIQQMIAEILLHENPNAPLSDERVAQMLAERGVHVARRTVNKYRDRTKLLSSRRRRSA